MAATVDELLQGKPGPVTTRAEESLQKAIELMVQHDYSQLPVVDNAGCPSAILSADSIVRALNNFGVAPSTLRVGDAMHERFKRSRADVDLLDVLDDLKNAVAVLVVDAREILIGIITTYDTTEYFKLRTQDIMLVQDIEELIKDYVRAPFTNEQDVHDAAQLQAAIDEITPSNAKELRGPFTKALEHYLKQSGTIASTSVDGKLAGEAFEKHLQRKATTKPFDKLTLNEYIELLLHKSRWPLYDPALRIDRNALHRLLSRVRDTRNDLAHFRTEISEQQREELRFCRDWLGRQEDAIAAAFSKQKSTEGHADSIATNTRFEPAQPDNMPQVSPPLDELARPADSRYTALASWLQEQPLTTEHISLRFAQIEKIIGDQLPWSAREHRSWWANDSTRHVQSKQWLHAGWRVASVNPRGEIVVFVRNKERERAYSRFFEAMIEAIRKVEGFSFEGTHSGSSWLTIAPMPNASSRVGYLNLSFARTRQFRIELYIDSNDRDENKVVFDRLYDRKASIESDLGEALSWERIDEKRACRVAIYLPGIITDSDTALDALRQRTIPILVRFRQVMSAYLNQVLDEKRVKGKPESKKVPPLLVQSNEEALSIPLSHPPVS